MRRAPRGGLREAFRTQSLSVPSAIEHDIAHLPGASSFVVIAGVLFQSAIFGQSIRNGDFDDVAIGPAGFKTIPLDVPGWTHSGAIGDALLFWVGYHDGGGSILGAARGTQFATLGGGNSQAGSLSWSTTISGLISGALYELSFMIANENVGGPQGLSGDSRAAPLHSIGLTQPPLLPAEKSLVQFARHLLR